MARWGDVIELVPLVPGTNEYGDPIMIDGPAHKVFANKTSVRQSEFYQAMQTGLRPEIMFEVRSAEYRDDPKLRYDGREYSIIRTYDKGETMELICGGLVGS